MADLNKKKGTQPNSSRMIRIAHVQLLPLMSGVQRVTLDELSRLDRKRFAPHVICKEPGPFTEALESAGIPFFCVPEMVREISPILDLRALWKLYRMFQSQKFDIVQTFSSKPGILGRFAGQLAGVPVVMHNVQGFAFPAAKGFLHKFLYFLLEWFGARMTDAMVLVNPHDLEIAKNRLGLPNHKLHLIPNGIDTDRYSPPALKKRQQIRHEMLGLGKNHVGIGMVGRLWPQKNPECFVQAAIRLLRSGHKSLRFFLIGDGEERPQLEEIIRKEGFEKEIRILGWRNDVDRLLGGMDIFVLPSRWEGMPLAILEAMSLSLPVVASNVPGNSDLVANGVTGYLFEPENAEELAEKLEILLRAPSRRSRMGKAGLSLVKISYGLSNRLKIMECLYLDLLTKP